VNGTYSFAVSDLVEAIGNQVTKKSNLVVELYRYHPEHTYLADGTGMHDNGSIYKPDYTFKISDPAVDESSSNDSAANYWHVFDLVMDANGDYNVVEKQVIKTTEKNWKDNITSSVVTTGAPEGYEEVSRLSSMKYSGNPLLSSSTMQLPQSFGNNDFMVLASYPSEIISGNNSYNVQNELVNFIYEKYSQYINNFYDCNSFNPNPLICYSNKIGIDNNLESNIPAGNSNPPYQQNVKLTRLENGVPYRYVFSYEFCDYANNCFDQKFADYLVGKPIASGGTAYNLMWGSGIKVYIGYKGTDGSLFVFKDPFILNYNDYSRVKSTEISQWYVFSVLRDNNHIYIDVKDKFLDPGTDAIVLGEGNFD
ncbi:MAG: hypothetical protein WA057_03710, partial [Candidatus Magasanikiibacteriota bacterium]